MARRATGAEQAAVRRLLFSLSLTQAHARPRTSVEAHTGARAGMCTTDWKSSVFTARIKNEQET